MKSAAFSLVEMLAAVAIALVLMAVAIPGIFKLYESSSLAVSASNIRQLTAGGSNYLAENKYTFWKYLDLNPEGFDPGSLWWFGYERKASTGGAEGSRKFSAIDGPLGEFMPAGMRADPSFTLTGKAFKPKFATGYLGIGYNVLLGGGWLGTGTLRNYWQLSDPSQVVVFFTSAQVNTFQKPASASNPMLEEFYGIDLYETTVHFRHHGKAMVAFANGAAGFLPMDETTRDQKMPKANVGRFAPKGDSKYLK